MQPGEIFPYPGEWVDEEAELLSGSIREWGEKEVMPHRQKFDEDYENKLVGPAMKALFVDIGVQKLLWPEEYGGGGLNSPDGAVTITRALEEIGRADPGIGFVAASTLSALLPIVMAPNVNKKLCAEFAPLFCNADEVRTCSLILPEQGGEGIYGAAPAAARLKGGEWVISGEGMRPASSGSTADLFSVFCAVEGERGLAVIAVPGGADGIRREKPYRKMGLASDRNATVHFENVRVPKRYCVCQGDGDECFKGIFSWYALYASAVCAGSMLDVYRIVKQWADSRVMRGHQRWAERLLKEHPVDAAVLADVAEDIAISRLVTYDLARMLTRAEVYGEPGSDELFTAARVINLFVTDAAVRSSDRAMELMASQGYARGGELEKHWRDVRTIQAAMERLPALRDIARYFYASGM
jgi:alkylation response protein AidB-like acyl-CoA dehydrogenase